MLIGHIDAFERGKLYGWAFNPDDANEHLLIYVHAGNDILADGIANLKRRDLPEAGIGAGDHAFELRLPADVKSLDNVVVIGQSARHGEIVLPMLSDDNQQLNTILQIHSSRYNAALQQLKTELDTVAEEVHGIKNDGAFGQSTSPEDASSRLGNLEKRIDAMEVFLVRMDETLLKLVQSQPHKRKWGFSRKPGNG
jgi:hypothetical protein